MMFEPRRLHPISAVINFVKTLKDAALPLIIVFFLNGNMFSGAIEWLPLLIWLAVLLLVLGSGILRWLRFSYRMEEEELRIEYGFIFRKKRYIPIDRIQSLDFSEGIFHRSLNLVKVSVETAGSTGNQSAEAELTAIKREEANELESLIFQVKNQQQIIEEEEDVEEATAMKREKVYGMGMKEIILMAITSGGAGVVISGVGVFFSQIMDVLPLGTIYDEVLDWIQIGFLIVAFTALLVLLIAYGISILLTVLRYAHFSVYVDADDLVLTRGWLEKKQMTIPLNRIQGIRIDENLIRQPLGYASVTLISAGGSVQANTDQQLRLLPMIKKKKIETVMQHILADYEVVRHFEKPPARSKYRYFIRHSWLAWIAAILISVFFFPYGLLSIIAGLVFVGLGWLAYHDAGWNLSGRQLTLRNRMIIKQTYVMKRHRIQAASATQTFLQKRADLGSVRVTLKSGGGGAVAQCSYIEYEDTKKVLHWYQPR